MNLVKKCFVKNKIKKETLIVQFREIVVHSICFLYLVMLGV